LRRFPALPLTPLPRRLFLVPEAAAAAASASMAAKAKGLGESGSSLERRLRPDAVAAGDGGPDLAEEETPGLEAAAATSKVLSGVAAGSSLSGSGGWPAAAATAAAATS